MARQAKEEGQGFPIGYVPALVNAVTVQVKLQASPHVALLLRGSPNRLPCLINTTFESTYIPDGVASTV
jgi:hypothetical protein